MHHCHAVPIKPEAHANVFTVAVFYYQIITLANYHINVLPKEIQTECTNYSNSFPRPSS
jgi:hypothetical protein